MHGHEQCRVTCFSDHLSMLRIRGEEKTSDIEMASWTRIVQRMPASASGLRRKKGEQPFDDLHMTGTTGIDQARTTSIVASLIISVAVFYEPLTDREMAFATRIHQWTTALHVHQGWNRCSRKINELHHHIQMTTAGSIVNRCPT